MCLATASVKARSRTGLSRAPQSFLLLVLSVSLAVVALANVAMASTVGETVREIVTVEIERAGGMARSVSQPVALRFDAFGRHFDLALEQNFDLVAPGLAAALVNEEGRTTASVPTAWIGRGADGSQARLTMRGNEATGYVSTSAGTFLIEPAVAQAGAHSVRRAQDMLADNPGISCGVHGEESEEVGGAASSSSRTQVRAGTLRALGVSVVADSAFYARHGLHSVEDLLALFNQVDGIFRDQLGIALQIVQLVVYQTQAAEPFSSTTSPPDLLSELSAARLADPSLTMSAGGITHLVSGRSLGGLNGIAWIAGVCDGSLGAGLSAVGASIGYMEAVLVAHEIGHNLGAFHDGPNGAGCETTPSGFIMWPWLQSTSSNEFSTCSKSRIATQTSFASCLGALAPSSCGNGVIDADEECDAGNVAGDACCRSNCTFAFAGLPCGPSGDVCLDSICNGAGFCVDVPNDSSCSAADACMNARCSGGECVDSESPRAFENITASMRLDALGMVQSAKISAALPMLEAGSDPSNSGVEILATLEDLTAWQEFIPAELWQRKGSTKFKYKAADAAPGHLRSAKIQLDAAGNRAIFRLDFAKPMGAMLPTPPTIQILAGNRTDGQCAVAGPLSRCTRNGGNYTCE